MYNKAHTSPKRGGFSLVELMVVIMIIGLMTYAVSMSFDSMVPVCFLTPKPEQLPW